MKSADHTPFVKHQMGTLVMTLTKRNLIKRKQQRILKCNIKIYHASDCFKQVKNLN